MLRAGRGRRRLPSFVAILPGAHPKTESRSIYPKDPQCLTRRRGHFGDPAYQRAQVLSLREMLSYPMSSIEPLGASTAKHPERYLPFSMLESES